MNRTIFVLVIAVFLQSCASRPREEKPKGEWLWSHPELYSQMKSGVLTEKEVGYKFTVTKNKCKIDALKVPVPSPSCYVVPAPDCAGLTGFALGYCVGQGPEERCDYSSVNAAKGAQFEIFKACMELEGWERIWTPYDVVTEK